MIDSQQAADVHLNRETRALLAGLRQQALLNYGEMIAVKQTFEHPVEHDEIERSFLAAINAIFAESENFDALYGCIREPGAVLVLNLPPDSGRTTLAYALLARLVAEGKISQARTLRYGGASDFPVRRLPHEQGQGFLLALPADDEESEFQITSQFGSRIHTLSEELKTRQNRLIVLTYPEQWLRVSMGAPPGIAPAVAVASPQQIADKWLAAEEPGLPRDMWFNSEAIQQLFRGAMPTDVLQVVDHILAAHRAALSSSTEQPDYRVATEDGRRAFHRLAEDVVQARRNWRKDLLDWHRKVGRTSIERNFLLAASVLRGAPVANVYASASALSVAFEETAKLETSGQSSPGVIELLDAVNGEIADTGTITFRRPGWDDAVLEYFWIDRPLARRQFLTWLAEAPTKDRQESLESLGPEDREALARRIVLFALRWAVRHRRPDPLRVLAEAWHVDTRARPMWSVLIELLAAAAAQETSSSYLHPMLLTWSKSKRPALQKAVIAVCAGEFGRAHTGKAMRRLKHAAASHDATVVVALRSTIRDLWVEDSVRPALLEFMSDWCADQTENALGGHQAFAALASAASPANPTVPLLLHTPDDGEDRDLAKMLPLGWRTLLDQPQSAPQAAEAKAAVSLWMGAALHSDRIRAIVLRSLSEAVKPGGPPDAQQRRDRLRIYAVSWSETGGDEIREMRRGLYAELSQLLDNDLNTTMDRQLRHQAVDKEP